MEKKSVNHKNLNILMMPDFLKSNPYLRLLHDSLIKRTEPVRINIRLSNFNHTLFPVIRSLSKGNRPDILHLHWIIHWLGTNHSNSIKSVLKFFLFMTEVFLLKHFFKTKLVWTAHNLVSHECKREKMEIMGRRYLAGTAKTLICHSRSSKEEIAERYRITLSKIEVISHGHYINSYKNVTGREKSREILKLHPDDFVFLFFGIIRRYKGINHLIDNFLDLNLDSAKLVIAGYTPDRELKTEMMAKIEHSDKIVPMIEFVPDEKIQILMNASDIVVLPYQKILTSGAAVLAMSFGKSIIGPGMGCLPEILNSQNNFLFNPNEQKSLKKSMLAAFNHRQKLESLGRENLQRIQKDSWEMVGEKTLDVYIKSIE